MTITKEEIKELIKEAFEDSMNNNPIGCMLAKRLTSALIGVDGSSYEKISGIIYSELRAITEEQKIGDWIEMPNGDTYTLTHKIGQ